MLKQQASRIDYNYKEWYVDSIEEMNELDTSDACQGSICYIINDSNVYMLDINKKWVKQTDSTGGEESEGSDWQPRPDWWDIKSIVENDTEDYPYKIICLHDEGAKTLKIAINELLLRPEKVKLSDGQEITTSGIYTVKENGLKNCSKGYKTFYSIWYFNNYPNFGYTNIGNVFYNSRYIYFYNVERIGLNSVFAWVSNANRLLEAIESNKQITTDSSNGPFSIFQANCLRKIPDLIFNRAGNNNPPNVINFNIAPYIKYEDMTKIINSRNFEFTSGTAPAIANCFFDETIDFENDWGMQTNLFTTTNDIIGPYAIQKMDFENVTNFRGTLDVSEIYEVYNIKKSNNYFNKEMLSHDTLVRILNALYNYSDSEDMYTLTLGNVNLAKLTDDEKAIATDKGWTLA